MKNIADTGRVRRPWTAIAPRRGLTSAARRACGRLFQRI